MAKAIIYRPDKNAMQSGTAKMQEWIFKFKPEKPYFTDNLMGWVGMTDMPQEVQLYFSTKQAAIEYANRQRIPYDVVEPHRRTKNIRAYADNFKFNQMQEKPQG